MLLRAEDDGKFSAQIEEEGVEFWASYRMEGRVKGQPMTQSDRRMFASGQEARMWLICEAEKRGFKDFEPKMQKAA